jgi:hypothetical protein
MSEYFVGTTGNNNQTNFESLNTSQVLDDLGLNTGDAPTFSGLFVNSTGTGANNTLFSVDGSNGRLFGVTDEVTGTVFSVNDAAGLPILEVESTSSYDKITVGEYGSDLLVLSGQTTAEVTGSQIATQDWIDDQGFLPLAGGTMTGNLNMDGSAMLNAGYIGSNTESSRSKIRLHGTVTDYAIGMQSGCRYGGLSDWAMTFQFNDESDRGFWWGDSSHSTAAQGAMAVTTDGKLSVARTIRVGYGEADTTTPSISYADFNLPVKHRFYIVSSLPSAYPAGQRAFVSDSSYGLATAIGAVVSGGGSNTIPVFSDGSSWRAG